MKTQLLVYRQRDCGFTETGNLTIREFSRASAFDAFELTIINLQDEHLWKSDYYNDNQLKDHADISSIGQMMLQSNKCKCIVLLPQNCMYSYCYEYDSQAHAKMYKHNMPLKDFIKNLAHSSVGELFPLPLHICLVSRKRAFLTESFIQIFLSVLRFCLPLIRFLSRKRQLFQPYCYLRPLRLQRFMSMTTMICWRLLMPFSHPKFSPPALLIGLRKSNSMMKRLEGRE